MAEYNKDNDDYMRRIMADEVSDEFNKPNDPTAEGLGGASEQEMKVRMVANGRFAQQSLESFVMYLHGKFIVKDEIKILEARFADRTDDKKKPGSYGVQLKEQIAVRLAKEEEYEKYPEKLREGYNSVWEIGLAPVEDLFKEVIDQRKNAYPIDYKIADQTVRTILNAAKTLQKEGWVKNNQEAKVYFLRLERDATYLASFLQDVVGQSASLPSYFDVVQQLQTLKVGYKAAILTRDIEYHLSKELPGMEFGPQPNEDLSPEEISQKEAEKKLADENVGFEIPKKYKTVGYTLVPSGVGLIKNGEVLGLKELGTRLQDASVKARFYVAAVSQLDLRLSTADMLKSTFKGKYLDKEHVEFFRQVFWGETRKVKPRNQWKDPKEIEYGESAYGILAPHVVSVEDDRKKSEAKLEAILTTNAMERLEEIIAGGGADTEKAEKIKQLSDEVNKAGNDRFARWDKRGQTDIVSRLACLVTTQGLVEDYAYMRTYRFCWQYLWKKPWDGKSQMTSGDFDAVEFGSIFSRSGDHASLWYQRKCHNYDGNSNTRTPLMPPTSAGGRAEARLLGLDEMPMIYDPSALERDGTFALSKKGEGAQLIDDFLKSQLEFLFSDSLEAKKARFQMGYQDLQDDTKEQLMRWLVRYRTPFSTKYVEFPNGVEVMTSDKSQTNFDANPDMEIVVPNFLPTGLPIANFNEATTVGYMKLNDGAVTIWDQLVADVPQSKIKWGRLDEYQHGRWLVDLDMSSNFMHILIDFFDPADRGKEGAYNTITAKPSTSGPKWLANKIRLAFRDSPKGYPEDYETAMIANIIVLAVANKHGITDAEAWKKTGGARTTEVDNFIAEMAEWKRAFKWLAFDRPSAARREYRDYPKNDVTRWKMADSRLLESIYSGRNKTAVDSQGFILNKEGKRIKLKPNYGNQIALVAEFLEGIILREAKSSAEGARALTTSNYQQTVNRLNGDRFNFIRKGNIHLTLNAEYKVE